MAIMVERGALHIALDGQVRPQAIAHEMAELWQWMAAGQVVTRGSQLDQANVMAEQVARLVQDMLVVWARDFGVSDEEARAELAARCGIRREAWGAEGRADWSWVVAQAALGALRECSAPMLHDQSLLSRLWLVACRDAGAMFMSAQEAMVRMVYFGPAYLEGWMGRAAWFSARSSVNRAFSGLDARYVVCQHHDSELLGQVQVYGLTSEGYGHFREELQEAGLLASALDRMTSTLSGARLLPASYPAALLADPDTVRDRRVQDEAPGK